jgi:hypothetical protein
MGCMEMSARAPSPSTDAVLKRRAASQVNDGTHIVPRRAVWLKINSTLERNVDGQSYAA